MINAKSEIIYYRNSNRLLYERSESKSPTPHDNIDFWSNTDDSNHILATRASTCSLPITENSRKIQAIGGGISKSNRKSDSNFDLPLQRNMIDLDSKEVSPIIEDEKEDTFNAEHETADLAKHCSYDPFGDQGQSRHTAAKSKKSRLDF